MENQPKNHHPHKHFSPVSFLAGLLIALAVFFIIYKFVPNNAAPVKNAAFADSVKIQQPIVELKKDTLIYAEEHFYKSHHHTHIDLDVESIIVSPGETQALEKGSLSAEQKKLLELLPNAPVIYIFDLKVTSYQDLYFMMGIPVMIDNKIVAGQLLHDGLKDLTWGNYKGCFQKMDQLSSANNNDVNALFYAGMAAYYKKDLGESCRRFEKVIAAKNNTFHQEAKWFTAMAMFADNKREDAKKLFAEIANGEGFYAHKAAELLKQL
jgi:hypothetical protein